MVTKSASLKQTFGQKSGKAFISPAELDARIRKVAQEIFEKRGRISGHELEDWLEAEKRVKKELNLA